MQTLRWAAVASVVVAMNSQFISAQVSPLKKPSGGRLAGAVFSTAISKSKSLQRSNTLLEYSKNKQRLQIAIVIDGTDTMGEDIQSLTEHLQGLVTSLENSGTVPRPGSVSAAIVVFRDSDAPSGPVTVPFEKFSNDLKMIRRELGAIRPETGQPYYRERVDEGLHTALAKLDWAPASDDTTERWIIFCGDAPAYPADSTSRQHSDDDLIKLATDKKIRMCFVLCSSGAFNAALDSEKLKQTIANERPELEKFASEMAKKTGGSVLDTAKLQSADFWCDAKVMLDPITPQDIAAARSQKSVGEPDGDEVRIAVLPHIPLDQMAFSPSSRDEVVTARQLAEGLKKISGFDVKTSDSVEEEFARAQADMKDVDLKSSQGQSRLISALAKRLNADFVIWGETKSEGGSSVLESRLYRDRDGRMIATSHPQDADEKSDDAIRDLPSITLRRLCRKAATELRKGTSQAEPAVVAVFDKVNSDERVAKAVVTPLARDHRAQRAMLIGLEHLERSLQFAKQSKGASTDVDQDAATEHLQKAVAQFKQALEFDSENPLASLFLASCYFNLGHKDALDDWTVMRNECLQQAIKNVNSLDAADPARIEIQAEYALLVQKDYVKAVELYSSLISDKQQKGGRFGLRAHWMLAGIHLGDWGAISYAPSVLNAADARQNIISIIAHWPDSPEARFYEASLGKPSVPAGGGFLAMSR